MKGRSASWVALPFKGGRRQRGEEDPPQSLSLMCGQQIHSCFLWAMPVPRCMVSSAQHEEVTRGLPGVTRKRQLEGRNGTGCNDDSRQTCPHPPHQVRMSPKSTSHLPYTSLLCLWLTSHIAQYTVPNELSSFIAG